jgi:hypothetical protein
LPLPEVGYPSKARAICLALPVPLEASVLYLLLAIVFEQPFGTGNLKKFICTNFPKLIGSTIHQSQQILTS